MKTRSFALLLGFVFIALGLAGFVPGLAYPEAGANVAAEIAGGGNAAAPAAVALGPGHDMLFGLFPVNAAHNLIHLLFGLAGLVASRSSRRSLGYARAVAIIFALLAVAGTIPAFQTGFDLIPIYAKDIWLHGLIALVAAYFGWANRDPDAVAAGRPPAAPIEPETK